MKRITGIIMLASMPIALFVIIAMLEGVLCAVKVYATVVAIVAFICVAIYLIESKQTTN